MSRITGVLGYVFVILLLFFCIFTLEIQAQEVDSDSDGVPDLSDPQPFNYIDTDGDGLSDDYEAVISKTDPYNPDTDGDGFLDSKDDFPVDPNEYNDNDEDGIGDNSDPDDDNDGVNDTVDEVPLLATQWNDTDGDGYGDNQSGLDPDLFPYDRSLWNPMQLTDTYITFESEDGSFKIKRPNSWKQAVSGVKYDHLGHEVQYTVTFREPDHYTAGANVIVREIDEPDAVNTEEYLREVTGDFLRGARDEFQDFDVIGTAAYTSDGGHWSGWLEVRYSRENGEYRGKWLVTVSEGNGLLFIVTAETTADRYTAYEPYFDEILDSFEPAETDNAFLMVCIIFLVVVLINVVLIIIAMKKKRYRTAQQEGVVGDRIPASPPAARPGSYQRAPESMPQPARYRSSTYSKTLYCRVCDGTGMCTVCDGFGTVNRGIFGQNITPCSNCNGNGICPACRPGFIGANK